MEIYNHKINKKLISGNLPGEELLVPDVEEVKCINFNGYIEAGLNILKSEMENVPELMLIYKDRFIRLNHLGILEKHEVHTLINTGYFIESINENDPSYIKACELIPAVTELDGILLMGIIVAYNTYVFSENKEREDKKEVLFSWIYLLRELQDKELKYGFTISPDQYTSNSIFDIILSEWTFDRIKFIKLDKNLHDRISNLINKRAELRKEISENLLTGYNYAKSTIGQWKKFIEIINDLTSNEQKVFESIKGTITYRKKLNLIDDYEMLVYRIRRHKYVLNGQEINLLELFDSIIERYKIAAPYCKVSLDNGKAFRIHYAVLFLAMDPRTYNYYVMKYHQLRLATRKDYAREFVKLSLELLCKNLSVQFSEYEGIISVDDMIRNYYEIVNSFVSNNQFIIDSLKYNSIQMDGVLTGFFEIEHYSALIEEDMQAQINRRITIEDLKNEDTSTMLITIEQDEKQIEKIVIGHRLVVTLNMIYLFANAIDIILNNCDVDIIKNKEQAERVRFYLLKIDAMIVGKVYSDIPFDDMNIVEYREKNAIDITHIIKEEKKAEEYTNYVFAETLKSNISNLVKDIKMLDIEKLLETKKKLIQEVAEFPVCIEKELYASWIDQVCSDICDSIVYICKNQIDDYEIFKKRLKGDLGDDSIVLPEETMDSLTTAEILFDRYASDKYAKQGFDYSSISSLYYQAFETAYNKLIWEGYAKYLNELIIEGDTFTSLIEKEKNNELTNAKIIGYLDSKPKKRSYYIEYASNSTAKTVITSHCMYMNFGILMENISPKNKLDKFSEYFAKLTGFEDTSKMLQDFSFMTKCRQFTNAVTSSSKNRNNASHGGSFIDIVQCTKDKIRVLNNLKDVRKNSLGLIELLIDIMTCNKH